MDRTGAFTSALDLRRKPCEACSIASMNGRRLSGTRIHLWALWNVSARFYAVGAATSIRGRSWQHVSGSVDTRRFDSVAG